MKDVVIVDAVRTPIGRYKGALKSVRPDDLGAIVIKALTDRNPELQPDQIEDVIFGNANQAGEDNRDVAQDVRPFSWSSSKRSWNDNKSFVWIRTGCRYVCCTLHSSRGRRYLYRRRD
ncbi:hypothetical protein RCO48_36395 [Peribacillus frigoritolerans]|nr:hypothetical protein [Peribacillus frigoritolerans]